MTNIQAQLEQLFEFIKQLNILLDNEEYEHFQEQQDLLTEIDKSIVRQQFRSRFSDKRC